MTSQYESDELSINKRFLTLIADNKVGKGKPQVSKLASQFLGFTQEVAAGDAAKAEEKYKVLMRELSQLQTMAQKWEMVTTSHQGEREQYVAELQALESKIDAAHKGLEVKKGELDAAKVTRRQNQEYESLRRTCMKVPSRSDTQADIDSAVSDIAESEAEMAKISASIQLRKKQFVLLMHTISELTGIIEDEEIALEGEAQADEMAVDE